MRKKKQPSPRKLAGRRFNRAAPAPAPPLSRRTARTIVAPAAEPNHYLQLADIALGSETGLHLSRKEKVKP